MIRRLALAGLAILTLSACDGGSKPAATPAPAAKGADNTPTRYKATPSKVLNAVRKRGFVACGVNPGLPGFAFPDFRGAWLGLRRGHLPGGGGGGAGRRRQGPLHAGGR
jgi:general L-amino acid transport system substrate-binding protein